MMILGGSFREGGAKWLSPNLEACAFPRKIAPFNAYLVNPGVPRTLPGPALEALERHARPFGYDLDRSVGAVARKPGQAHRACHFRCGSPKENALHAASDYQPHPRCRVVRGHQRSGSPISATNAA